MSGGKPGLPLIRVIVGIVAAGLVLAACASMPEAPSNSPPVPSAAPVVSPAPSEESSPPALATVAPSEPGDSVPLPVDAYARVVTDDLRVRSKPGVSDDSAKLEPLLQDGQLLVVVDGPVQASGYDWYEVVPIVPLNADPAPPYGWVAAGDKDGQPWIRHESIACPAPPDDLGGVASLTGGELVGAERRYYEITCFSQQEITIQARLVTPSEWCGLGEWDTWEPVWFDVCRRAPNYLVPVNAGLETDGAVVHPAWRSEVDLTMAPPVEASPEEWPLVEVTGTFDHPEARSCHVVGDNPPEPDTWSRLWCRLEFAVTSMREIDR